MPRFQFIPEGPFLKKWFFFSLAAGLIIPFTYFPQAYTSLAGFGKIYDDMIYSFFISLGISGTVWIVEHNLNRLVPWIEAPAKRLLLEVLGVSIFGFTIVFVVSFLFYWLFGVFDLDNIPWRKVFRQTKEPMVIGYIITAFFISRAFLMQWRDAAVNNQTLRAERYKGQVRLLRDQLNPHFLFNSFNVLIDVVYEDQDKAADFIRELSKFYRHILEVQNEDLVPLVNELGFTKRYASLQQRRFGEALVLDEAIKPGINEEIPPLVLQLLVENAIKHNAAEIGLPLKIEIRDTAEYIIVKNNLNLKRHLEEGTGIGLDNIRKRYQLLSNQEVQVEQTATHFMVKLPRLFPKNSSE